MDDIQRPNSLVTGIACAKHLYAPWHGNRCHIEKVLNFPETSMSIKVKRLSTAPAETHGLYSEAKFIGCRYSTCKVFLCYLA
jgi:hypothetical protein